MKKIALALTVFSLGLGLIYAGPEPLPSGKEMKEVAPAPAPPTCFDWRGFYIGGFGGYKFSSVDLHYRLEGEWTGIPESKEFIESVGAPDLDNDGGEVGGLIGYNFQWNCWVLGVEADGGYLFARDSHDTGTLTAPDEFDFHVRSAFRTHYLFTFGPRIGYAIGNWLPYITGGLAVGDLELEQVLGFPGQAIPGVVEPEGGRHSETNLGWMVGGGLQYALTQHWSIRAQYQYIDLGDVDFTSQFVDADAPTFARAELREHNASFAIMYKF